MNMAQGVSDSHPLIRSPGKEWVKASASHPHSFSFPRVTASVHCGGVSPHPLKLLCSPAPHRCSGNIHFCLVFTVLPLLSVRHYP